MWIEIGNESAIEGYREPGDERVRYRPLEGERITRVLLPEDMPLQEAFTSAVKLVAYHIAEGEKPSWVDSDSANLARMLKEHFSIKGNRPKTWGKNTGADQLPSITEFMATSLVLASFMLTLRTNAGRDWQANVMGAGQAAGAGTGTMRPADYIGLTNDATAPDAARTTLPNEVTSGSLGRAQGAFAHTNGTASYTLTKTFTSDQTINVAKIGVFNAASGGTMAFETLLNAVAPLQSGDQLAITETITL